MCVWIYGFAHDCTKLILAGLACFCSRPPPLLTHYQHVGCCPQTCGLQMVVLSDFARTGKLFPFKDQWHIFSHMTVSFSWVPVTKIHSSIENVQIQGALPLSWTTSDQFHHFFFLHREKLSLQRLILKQTYWPQGTFTRHAWCIYISLSLNHHLRAGAVIKWQTKWADGLFTASSSCHTAQSAIVICRTCFGVTYIMEFKRSWLTDIFFFYRFK